MLEEDKDRKIIELIAKVDALTSRLLVVEARCTYLEQENKALRKENKQLRVRLLRYETPKNSNNSSLPPSSDMYSPKKNQSLRITSGNKAGGQVGRKGKTLEMVSCPDHVIDHKPFYCTFCQSTLEGLVVEQIGRR